MNKSVTCFVNIPLSYWHILSWLLLMTLHHARANVRCFVKFLIVSSHILKILNNCSSWKVNWCNSLSTPQSFSTTKRFLIAVPWTSSVFQVSLVNSCHRWHWKAFGWKCFSLEISQILVVEFFLVAVFFLSSSSDTRHESRR